MPDRSKKRNQIMRDPGVFAVHKTGRYSLHERVCSSDGANTKTGSLRAVDILHSFRSHSPEQLQIDPKILVTFPQDKKNGCIERLLLRLNLS